MGAVAKNLFREIGFVFDISEKYRRSSKLEILMTYLSEAVNAAKKCIVLSHFHPMLLLLEYDLAVNEVDYLVFIFEIFFIKLT